MIFQSVTPGELRRNVEIDYSQLKIEKEIGRGNFGVVFKGFWRGGAVAIKQLAVREGGLSENDYQSFKHEASLMAQLRPHVNVVQFLGATFSPSPLCIITEYLDQGSLYTYIHDPSSKFTDDIIRTLALGIAAGMNHLHQEDLVHNDLASRNILIGNAFHLIKITDFGLSKWSFKLQQKGNELGPIKWMAPEAIKFSRYSKASDVYSYGVTLWEIIARSKPFPGVTIEVAAEKIANGTLRFTVPPECPTPIGDIMRSCLSFDPNQRPSFDSILETLQSYR